MTHWQWIGIGYLANIVAGFLVNKFTDKDPTHQDVVDSIMILTGLVPFALAFFSALGSVIYVGTLVFSKIWGGK